jgi:hypothetical protein
MSNENLHPLDAAIEKHRRQRNIPGTKRKRGKVAHAKEIAWLERRWTKLPEEEKERLRNAFDSLGKGDVHSK